MNINEMARVGAQLANIAYNLGQEAGPDLTPERRATLMQCSREWDKAVRDRATEAGTPATGKKPQRMKWTADNGMEDDPNGVWCRFDVAEAWAEEARREAATLANAIGNAAIKAGITRPDAPLTGPQLLSVLDDMATALAQRTAGGRAGCVGCEGKPSAENNPCAVCGNSTVEEAAAQADGAPTNEELQRLWDERHAGHPADFAADVLERWGGWPAGVLGQGGSLAAPTAQPTPPDDELIDAAYTEYHRLRSIVKVPGYCCGTQYSDKEAFTLAVAALRHPPVPNLDASEQYRCQMSAISTASLGYWKEGDVIHPDYDTVPLRDVARLYAKYEALHAAQPTQAGAEPVRYAPSWVETIDEDGQREEPGMREASNGKYYRASDVDPIITDLRARLASAGAGEDAKPVKRIDIGEGYYLLHDSVSKGWQLFTAGSFERWLDEFEEQFVNSAIRAARQDSAAADKGEA